MCKKTVPATVVVAVRLGVVERERLAMIAAQRQETISEFARRALAAAMANEAVHYAASA